jgi:acyl-coenzyme A thioesterase PaaI-like protein
MADTNKPTADATAQAIRERVLRGISLNRNPGLHFPGYFVDFQWDQVVVGSARLGITDGPHCRNAGGEIDITALALLVDMALGASIRESLAPGARLATTRMHIQLTGAAVRGDLSAAAHLHGFTTGSTLRQAMSSATLYAAGNVVGHASGEFGILDPPRGVKLAPLPWQRATALEYAPLTERDLDAHERPILKACDTALAQVTTQAAFIQNFWAGIPRHTPRGATIRVAVGLHLGNRVGHVQGGIMLGIAATTACAAAPAHMRLSNASAWYISPGQGKSLRATSRVTYAGRSIAVVHTMLKGARGEPVVEAVTHHVARLPA